MNIALFEVEQELPKEKRARQALVRHFVVLESRTMSHCPDPYCWCRTFRQMTDQEMLDSCRLAFGTRGLFLCCLARKLGQIGERGDPEKSTRTTLADDAARASERLFQAIQRGQDDRWGADAVSFAERVYDRWLNPPKPVEQPKPEQPDSRPGHYYVSAFDPAAPSKGPWLLAGPWPIHEKALKEKESVRAYAERVDPKAVWMAFGTCRMECPDDAEAPKSKLGDDPQVWRTKC